MIALDSLYGAFVTALTGDATVAALVPGGWRQGRHQQTPTVAGNYGVIRFDPVETTPFAGGMYRRYTLTLQVYANASATAQAAIQAALAALFDFKPAAVTSPTGGSVNMIVPRSVDQRIADQMRSGADVVPVTQAWAVKTVETRA